MSRILTIAACLILILQPAIEAETKKAPRLVRVGDVPTGELRAGYTISAADTCIVRHDAGISWRIDNWIIGNELYKSYLDPAASCQLPYPFTVTEINMPMVFHASTPLIVAVDIEEADLSNPNCPVPGQLLAISSQYEFVVSEAGIYDIWIPLDTPFTVDGPFFAGFFIGNTFEADVNPGLLTDSIPMQCVSYNIWDTTLGFVDLGNNVIYNFPGRLILYASGYPGGSGGVQPEPSLSIIFPAEGDTLLGFSNIWSWENSGSEIIDFVIFEARPASGAYLEIGRDFDGSQTLRDGLNPATIADGFSQFWDFSTRSEGDYVIRATAVDTSGRTSVDSIAVYLEPTPPVPRIVSPGNGSDFCPDVNLLFSLFDEDFSRVEAHVKKGDTAFSLNLIQLVQSNYGDNNGNPLDGNSYTNGEYGDYYSGPIAATQAIRVWYDRGYKQFMRSGLSDIPINEFVELMAGFLNTRNNSGTYDENMIEGLRAHLDRFDLVDFDFFRDPDYYSIRSWLEDEERSVILGLGGAPGMWVAADGFSGWKQADSSFVVRVANPETGFVVDALMRNNSGINEIKIGSSWQSVDIMISLFVRNWNVSRQLIGTDVDGSDGWSINWTPTALNDGAPYFFRATGFDQSGITGNSTILMSYNCANFFVKGDYNGDNLTNMLDLIYLIDFQINSGPAPVGGVGRADANCDNNVNIADAVYFINFMFGSSGTPCY
ncbi:MAG: hypothetical protein IID63_03640 [candidate division Zixibacteria bacterium]|nr:hypothetical protein [candidate division Zixibacteria bacterium]